MVAILISSDLRDIMGCSGHKYVYSMYLPLKHLIIHVAIWNNAFQKVSLLILVENKEDIFGTSYSFLPSAR